MHFRETFPDNDATSCGNQGNETGRFVLLTNERQFLYGSIDDKLRHTIVKVALEVTFLRLVSFTANFDIVNDAIYYQ